jgi:hypothetical protein
MKLSYFSFDADAVTKSFAGDYTFDSALDIWAFFETEFEVGADGLGCLRLTDDDGVEYSLMTANTGEYFWVGSKVGR